MRNVSDGALGRTWRQCRRAAYQGELSHARLFTLVKLAVGQQRLQLLHHWLPLILRQAVSEGERSGSAVALADWLQQQGAIELAALCLEQVHWPAMNGPAWLLRGVIEQRRGEQALAEASLAQACLDKTVQAEASYRLGELQRAHGHPDRAAGWFLASLQRNPDHYCSHNSLQYLRLSPAMRQRVLQAYVQITSRRPQSAFANQLLAHYLLLDGQLKNAITVSRRAARLELGPQAQALAPESQPPTSPDFLIIGVPKGGTTSLLQVLSHHPGVWCHPRKELQFFDRFHHLGADWYCAQFPRFLPEAGIARGEASPTYFHCPEAPQRIVELMPKVRCIVLLRDPWERALSWLNHLQRLEGLDHDPIALLEQELQAIEHHTPASLSGIHQQLWSRALQDSCYDAALRRWDAVLPQEQLLLVSSERLFAHPEDELNRILTFLQRPTDSRDLMPHWRACNVGMANQHQTFPGELLQRIRETLDRHCHGSFARINT
ncbi:sulfotransferase domain-containing protein [Synechococcus sp. HK01-R]|uniref:sulfotransferase domain-containing protein n=1 Tax=Synechococcus sp. HK01-R TaxID=2751171 RepID=UPI0016293E28|nr:sulfotransferase domain-containing protein [Synechococcus sp. HK01-R]QNG27851.1 sulfotransferase domain-containing protein [Synechococcus sp. HK01-R]